LKSLLNDVIGAISITPLAAHDLVAKLTDLHVIPSFISKPLAYLVLIL